MTPNEYQTYLKGKRANDPRFDDSSLAPQFVPYLRSNIRIEVERSYPSGEVWRRRGTIGVTGGWRPCFLLMSRRSAIGSSDCLGVEDRIVRVIGGPR